MSPKKAMRISLLFVVLLIGAAMVRAQPMLKWETLADVRFAEKYSNSMGMPYYQAQFGERVSALAGREVMVYGYLIPLDALGEAYVLSKNPFAACFFCGASGPETIVELRIKAEYVRRYATDERRAFKGRLQLNASSLEQFNYVLLDAEPL